MQKMNLFSSKFFLIVLTLIITQFSTANFAYAGTEKTYNKYLGEDEITCTLQRIVDAFEGPLGKAIATIAIIALGIGLFMGKLSWGLAVATALGIAMIFGAGNIVKWLSNDQFGNINTKCTPAASAA